MGGSGESLLLEAVKPLAPVEREKDVALLQAVFWITTHFVPIRIRILLLIS
jgi:hypothetical protein